MKRYLFALGFSWLWIASFALTENEGASFVRKYYNLLNQYATAEDVSVARRIEGYHIGSGYVYPDVEINLGRGMSETKGVAIKSVYLSSISARQDMLLKFNPKNIVLESNYNGICTMAYTMYVYAGNERPGQDIFKYSVPLKMEIQDGKIRSIQKGTHTTTVPKEEQTKPGSVQNSYTQSDGSIFYLYGNTVAPYANASGLSYLTNAINERKVCRTGAITEKIGVVTFGDNGYAYTSGISQSLADKLKEAHENKHTIHDVTISNNGNYWCIMYGNGGWSAVAPEAFYSKLREFLKAGEKVISVAIRDNGEFVIVTDKHFYASTMTLYDFIIAARDKYGTVHSVSLSNKGVVVCTERGVYFKNIPTGTYERLKVAAPQFKIRYVKFTDTGTCLITDGKSKYDYWM